MTVCLVNQTSKVRRFVQGKVAHVNGTLEFRGRNIFTLLKHPLYAAGTFYMTVQNGYCATFRI